jgi:hypothetical protein
MNETLIGACMWKKILTAALERDTARHEFVGPTAVFSIDETHEFRGCVTMVVWRAISVYNQSVIFPFSVTDGFFLEVDVREATSHRGEKIKKSARGLVRSRDLAVKTQKIEGSM